MKDIWPLPSIDDDVSVDDGDGGGGGSGDADVLLLWVSFRCQDRKRWADCSAVVYPLPMTSEVRTLVFTHRLRCIFSDH